VPAGSYSLTARATDNDGAVTTSSAVSVTVSSAIAQMYFILVDHLDTPRLIADSTGTTVWRNDNTEPFGDSVPNENPSGLGAFEFPLRFPGQYYDRETNLAYNYRRDYDPAIGRYVESDPVGLRAGLNTYLYVDAAPLTQFDILGLMGGGGNHAPRTTPRYPGSSCGPEGSNDNYPNSWGHFASFETACQSHDRCYENCAKTKGQCDSTFYHEMRGACIDTGGEPICFMASIAYYTAVISSRDAADAFRKGHQHCSNCD